MSILLPSTWTTTSQWINPIFWSEKIRLKHFEPIPHKWCSIHYIKRFLNDVKQIKIDWLIVFPRSPRPHCSWQCYWNACYSNFRSFCDITQIEVNIEWHSNVTVHVIMLQTDKNALNQTIFHFANTTEMTKWESGRILHAFYISTYDTSVWHALFKSHN